MLAQVRGALKGAVSWFIIILLVLAFALWGVPELRQLAGGSALTVGSERFSAQYIQNEFNRAMQIQRQENGQALTPAEAVASGLHTQVIESVAASSALGQFSDKLGLAVPRSIIRDYLQQNENFKNPATGQFDRFVLESILQRNGMSVAEFERRIGEDLRRNQLIGSLAGGAPAPAPFIDLMLLRETERRRIAYLTVTSDMAGEAAEPTPEDLQNFYNSHPEEFTAPEYRTFDLLVLRRDHFAADIDIPEEEIRRLYDANKERLYDTPETRTLYQLTYDSEAQALSSAAALRQGTPFENIAAARGLSIEAATFEDAQKSDILDPAVAEAAFAEGLAEGDVVDPVQGTFGWTLIQIAGVTPPSTTSFEEVREQIEADYLQNDTRRAVLEAVDQVEEERDTGASLESAAEAAGFAIVEVGPIDRYSFEPGGAIADRIPGEAIAEAFRLDEGEESEVVQLGENEGWLFVAVKEIREPALSEFELVASEVEDKWRKQEREQRLAATVQKIREAIESGQSLREAADAFDRAPIEVVIDQRFSDNAISAPLNREIFAADPGAVVSGPTAFGEAQVVAHVIETAHQMHAAPPQQEQLYREYVGYQIEQELVDAFVIGVRNDLNVKINQSQIDALFSDPS